MRALELLGLPTLMQRSRGHADIVIGLLDGPVSPHPDLPGDRLRSLAGGLDAGCGPTPRSSACLHGLFVAGILVGKRGFPAPAICPDCTLLVRPIFEPTETFPSTSPGELAVAIRECVEGGARLLNLSVTLDQGSPGGQRELEGALDHAARQQVLVIAAAGNGGLLRSSPITRHPWVISVVAYDLQGRPMEQSDLSASVGRRGVGAPGERITSLGTEDHPLTWSGTSVAAPFVTGTLALLWSLFPAAAAADLLFAVTRSSGGRRTVIPPLLDASVAYRWLDSRSHGGMAHG